MSSRDEVGALASVPDPRPLSEGQRALIRVLLADAFPGRNELVLQSEGCLAWPIDSNGSLKLRPMQGPAAPVGRRVPVEGDFDDKDGVVVHVLLHVIEGHLDELEIYREDSGPLLRPIEANQLRTLVL